MESPSSSQTGPVRSTAQSGVKSSHPQIGQPATGASGPYPNVTQIPLSLRRLEPAKPFNVVNDDPVFEVREAAAILGLSKELLTSGASAAKARTTSSTAVRAAQCAIGIPPWKRIRLRTLSAPHVNPDQGGGRNDHGSFGSSRSQDSKSNSA
jgi:hypothetical protein